LQWGRGRRESNAGKRENGKRREREMNGGEREGKGFAPNVNVK